MSIAASFLDQPLTCALHVYVAFDWAEEIDLERASALLPAQVQALTRRRRTPSSISYTPAPLGYRLGEVTIPGPGGASLTCQVEATVFDFGGVSVGMRANFNTTARELTSLADRLSDTAPLQQAARAAAQQLFETLRPSMRECAWRDLTEEYVVFQLPPGNPLPAPPVLMLEYPDWLASLTRLEASPLSREEVLESLHAYIGYSPDDLLVAEWSAAVLIDANCEETLQTIEFANLQLLEFRFIDRLLDERLADAYRLIHPLVQSRLPLWRSLWRPLRALGELRLDANNLIERTSNALKLVGDQYLARVYRLLSGQFHLPEWQDSIKRSLDALEGAYQVVSDQSAHFRMELLEIIVIVLIAVEIVMSFVRH